MPILRSSFVDPCAEMAKDGHVKSIHITDTIGNTVSLEGQGVTLVRSVCACHGNWPTFQFLRKMLTFKKKIQKFTLRPGT